MAGKPPIDWDAPVDRWFFVPHWHGEAGLLLRKDGEVRFLMKETGDWYPGNHGWEKGHIRRDYSGQFTFNERTQEEVLERVVSRYRGHAERLIEDFLGTGFKSMDVGPDEGC